MNRIEFSQQLIVQSESAGIDKNELCRLTGFTFNQLTYLENASNNYNINLVCTYLAAIKSKMVLLKGKKRKVICDFEGFADWMTSTRKLEYTQRALADKAGITYVTIANIESKKHIVRIDTLLKIVDVLGYTIKIENNEHFGPSSNREKRTV